MATAPRRGSLLGIDKPTATVFGICLFFGQILGAPRVWFLWRDRERKGSKNLPARRVK